MKEIRKSKEKSGPETAENGALPENVNRATMRLLPEEIRPYERAEALGEEKLSETELLAILLRSGTKERTALEVAAALMKQFGGLRGIAAASREKLSEVKGVGRVKAIVLRSAFELGKRELKEKRISREQIKNVDDLALLYMEEMQSAQEQVKVVLLDTKSRIIRDVTVSVGTANKAAVDPSDIFYAAIEGRARSIVLMHNHPTGDCSPSPDDYALTSRIFRAGKLLGITVADHLIFGDNDYYSFFESGDMMKIAGATERAG